MKGACMYAKAGWGVCGGGHAWQGSMCGGRGCAWQGACMAVGVVHGRGTCVAGGMHGRRDDHCIGW